MKRVAQIGVVFAGLAAAALAMPAPAAAQAQSQTNVARQVQERVNVVAKKVQTACKAASSIASSPMATS